jgi:hypothetical protein
MASRGMQSLNVFSGIDVGDVPLGICGPAVDAGRVRRLPLLATDVGIASQYVRFYSVAEHHWVADLIAHEGLHNMGFWRPLFLSGDQGGDVLRVDERLIGQRDGHRIQLARE